MLTTPRRRFAGSRTLTTSLALAASVVLTAAPVAGAQSTTQADGTIALGSLGSSVGTPVSASGSLGSLSTPAYAEYVALGDSYAAFGDQSIIQTGAAAATCMRSMTNYPTWLATNPSIGAVTDVSCGGAVTEDISSAQAQNVPPQVDALSSDTDLITLSIGGNDVGFGTIVGCITRQGPFSDLPGTSTCESQIGDMVDADIAEAFGVDGPVDDVYDTIAGAAPDATVIATQYLPLMPAEGTSCEFTDGLNPADVAWARGVAEAINDAVDVAADRNGHISVLPTDSVDRSACAAPEVRWTDFRGGLPTMAAPFHPTKLGQQAMAQAIAAAI